MTRTKIPAFAADYPERAVTLEQVKTVAQKYLKPDAFVVSVVKP